MSEPLRFSLRLPAHPVSVGVARAVVRSLTTAFPAQTANDAELLLSELVTNSVRHGSVHDGDPVEVELLVGDRRLSGTVSDCGPAFDYPTGPPDPTRIGGFGLHIAGSLGDLTVQHTRGGNRVAFSVPTSH